VLRARAATTYLPLLDFETKHLLRDLLHENGGAGRNCYNLVERTSASIVWALLYGFHLHSASDPLLVAAHSLHQEFNKLAQVGRYLLDSFPVLNVLPRSMAPWKDQAERHWERERAVHVGNLERGWAASRWNCSKTLRDYLRQEAIDMSIDELAIDLGSVTNAALDASSETTMFFLVACLTTDPGWISKAQQHLDAVVGQGRLPTFADRPRLLYIDAIVEEVLRWRPAGPAGIPHFTKVESTYNGHRIPANSVVIPNHWSITREEAVFGPDVEGFVPERWLPSSGEEKSASGLRNLPTVGFGYGRRACPGQHIARNMAWITFA
jgi:cytochrome P450